MSILGQPHTRHQHTHWVSPFASARCIVAMLALLLPAVALGHVNRPGVNRPGQEGQADDGGQQGQSSEAALAIYSDAANFQNNGAYDLAVEEWKKFLDGHRDDPLAPKAAHYLGVCYMRLAEPNLQGASDAFGKALDAKDSELRPESLSNRGWCQFTLAQATPSLSQADRKQRFQEAFSTYQTLMKEYPSTDQADQAYFYCGESLFATDRVNESIAFYEKMLDLPNAAKSPLYGQALYALGYAHEQSKQYDQALASYDRLLKDSSNAELIEQARIRRGDVLMAGNQVEAALKAFASAAEAGGSMADYALFRMAQCHNKLNQQPQAAKLYERLSKEFPKSPYAAVAQLAAAQSLYRAGKLDDAAKAFQTVASSGDKDSRIEAVHWLSQIALQRGKPTEAIELIEAAMPDAGDTPYARNLRMDYADALAANRETIGKAVELYEQIAREAMDDPLAPRALYNAGFAALQGRMADKAAALASLYLEKFPNDQLAPDVSAIGAEAKLLKQDAAGAMGDFERLIATAKEHPSRVMWVLRWATAAYLAGKYDVVTEKLPSQLKAFTAKPQQSEAEFLVGASHLFGGRPEKSIEPLKRSRSLEPDGNRSDEALLLIGQAQQKLGNEDDAVASWSALLKEQTTGPMADQARYRLGQIESAAGKFDTALKRYDEILAGNNPTNLRGYALYGRGWCLLQLKQFEPALASLNELLDKFAEHPLRAEAEKAKGICLRRLGRADAAIESFEKVLANKPSDELLGSTLHELVMVAVDQKQPQKAADQLQRLIDSSPKYDSIDQVIYEVAWSFRDAEAATSAAKYFQLLTDRFPESKLVAEASYHVGEQHYASKNWEAAESAYLVAYKRAGEDDLKEKSAYRAAWSQYQAQRFDEAERSFRDQVQKFAKGNLTRDASLMVAECQFKRGEYKTAFASFAKTRQSLRKPPSGAAPTDSQSDQLVLLHGGQSAMQMEDYKQATEWFEQLKQWYPATPFLAQTYYEMGVCQLRMEKRDKALELFAQVATNYRNEIGARARFMMGEIHFGQRDATKAIAEFQRVMYGFGSEKAPKELREWQAKSGYEAGRCGELLIQGAAGDKRDKAVDVAKKFYNYVIENHPDHPMAEKSRERIALLERK
jgi:cellulose synthase operon protein C